MRTDANTGTSGLLTVTSNSGIIVGALSELSLSVDSNNVNISNSYANSNINMRVWNGSSYTTILTVNGSTQSASTVTAAEGTNTTQLATTAFVQTATQKWDGSRKFVSTSAPTSVEGSDGDIWLQRMP
jgi:hypothetical protein